MAGNCRLTHSSPTWYNQPTVAIGFGIQSTVTRAAHEGDDLHVRDLGEPMTKIEQFFSRYEEGANSFDPDLVTSQFTASFGGGNPTGVMCAQNDEAFRKAITERRDFFQRIGFQSAKVLSIVETPLDEHYTLAKVRWHMVFEKEPGLPLDFRFFITYFLFDPGSGPKVAFFISHDDEQKVMREAGLIPTDA